MNTSEKGKPISGPLKLRIRPLNASRLRSKFEGVRETTDALRKANVVRTSLLKRRVGI